MIDCVSPGDSLTKETEDIMEVSKSSWSENEDGHVVGQSSGCWWKPQEVWEEPDGTVETIIICYI